MTMLSKSVSFFAICSFAWMSVTAQAPNIAQLRHQAEAGNAEAQYKLARAYYSGTGVAADPKQGLEWLRKSAMQNYSYADFALGVMFQLGDQSVSKNPHEAAAWFRKAAKQQNKDAQTRLATMRSQGLISKQEADWGTTELQPSPKKSQSLAFSLTEVETGLTGGITSKRMATLVNTFGVDFTLTTTARKRLSDYGADDNLLATIESSKRPDR